MLRVTGSARAMDVTKHEINNEKHKNETQLFTQFIKNDSSRCSAKPGYLLEIFVAIQKQLQERLFK